MTLTAERSDEETKTARRFIAPLAVGIPILLIVLATLGALTQQDIAGLPTVPGITLWGLPVDLWVRDAATAITLGGALVGGVLAPRPDPWLGRLVSLAAVIWLAAIAAQAVLTVSEVLALPLAESFNPTIVWSLLSQTTLGRVMLIQAVLVALVAVLGWVVLDRITGLIIMCAVLVAAFLPGFTGHSGIAEGHEAATISLGLHVVAASCWIGGFISTAIYLARKGPAAEVVLQRFSALALICVIVLAESGLLNAALRVDGPAALVTSQYGAIILAKTALLIVLIGYGWRARRAITANGGVPSVLRFATAEIALLGVVLGLSVALARTAPPAVPIAGDVIPAGSLIVLALLIPLAVITAAPRARVTVTNSLLGYPEALGAAVIIAMVIFGMLSANGFLPVQILAVAAMIMLPFLGWLFFTALAQARSWSAALLIAALLPIAAWWVERDVSGGLGAGTWVSVALGMGLVFLVVVSPRNAEVLA
ncbi:MAG: hypothetical protein RJB01_1792 [Actinomycetota bacterium]|jgi:putative copper export protein